MALGPGDLDPGRHYEFEVTKIRALPAHVEDDMICCGQAFRGDVVELPTMTGADGYSHPIHCRKLCLTVTTKFAAGNYTAALEYYQLSRPELRTAT